MNRAALAPFVVVLLTSSCAVFQTEARAPETAAPSSRSELSAERKRTKRAVTRSARKVGDFFVHRFSGSLLETPLLLTEEVAGREGSVWIIDYTLSEGEQVTKLRVHLDVESERPVRVLSLGRDEQSELSIDAYDALLERTAFAADMNDGLIDSHSGTCLIGPDELDCETKNYRVRIDDEEAKLSVTASKRFAGRDIAGEISAPDGTVIYRSELIEAGSSGAPKNSVASSK